MDYNMSCVLLSTVRRGSRCLSTTCRPLSVHQEEEMFYRKVLEIKEKVGGIFHDVEEIRKEVVRCERVHEEE